MTRKRKIPAPIVAVVLATGPLTGIAPIAPALAATPVATAAAQGVIKQRSDYDFAETVTRLKADIAAKGIRFFDEIDHTALGASADLPINRSKLLLFGNPPLGVQFLQSNPLAGLDWPVRLLVTEDGQGHVWAAYADFGWIAQRHGIKDREAQFKMASEVIASITSSVTN